MAAELRDPTRPTAGVATPPTATPSTRALVVQLIRIQGESPLAVINQRTVRVGDDIDGAVVVRIDVDAVQVRDSNGLRRLPLLNASNKIPASPSSTTKKLSGSTGS